MAVNHCGEVNPIAWLTENWGNMIETVSASLLTLEMFPILVKFNKSRIVNFLIKLKNGVN